MAATTATRPRPPGHTKAAPAANPAASTARSAIEREEDESAARPMNNAGKTAPGRRSDALHRRAEQSQHRPGLPCDVEDGA
jgi:hypothetical protein